MNHLLVREAALAQIIYIIQVVTKLCEYFGFSIEIYNLDELLFRYVSIVVNIQFSKDILQKPGLTIV